MCKIAVNTAEVSAPPPPRAANAHATQNVESARARLGLRTQSEIIPRGKQPTSQLNEIKSTMQENIEKLHERGERVRCDHSPPPHTHTNPNKKNKKKKTH